MALVSRNLRRHRKPGPRKAPPRRGYHREWRTSYIQNSAHGSLAARVLGDHWIDNDFHVTHGGDAMGNDHGAPLRVFFGKGDRMEKHSAVDVFSRTATINGRVFHIRTLWEALTDNHEQGIGTEIEIKDWRPWNTDAVLDARMAEIAHHSAAIYGANWRKHVNVKVLTDLGGGEEYALKVCRHAHAHTIPTILLARGKARFNHYYGHSEITWVRGSLVIKK